MFSEFEDEDKVADLLCERSGEKQPDECVRTHQRQRITLSMQTEDCRAEVEAQGWRSVNFQLLIKIVKSSFCIIYLLSLLSPTLSSKGAHR